MHAPSVITLLASAVRTATTTADPGTAINPQTNLGGSVTPPPPLSVVALIAYLNITAVPGIDTVLLKLQELEPVSQTWVDVVGAATLAQVGAGLVRLVVSESAIAVAAAITGVTANIPLPPNFRFQVVHSGAGNVTYSLALAYESR